MTVYKTEKWSYTIEPIEATRINDISYWYLDHKDTGYDNVWTTYEEAKQHIINRCNDNIEKAEQEISEAIKALEELK